MSAFRKFVKLFVLFLIGGMIYYGIEILWRGYSHPSMYILGGVCFVLVGLINEYFPWDMSFLLQSLIGAGIITGAELVTGIIVNIWLGLNVWDYSAIPTNIMGQICLPFSLLWVLLSGVAIVLDDYVRFWFFGEEKPHYSLL
jgi:uncharacterized membrane protein